MLQKVLEQFESQQTEKDVFKRPNSVVSDSLLCCLADKCAGTRKVYSDYDLRRAQRPYQTEDYCLESSCRFRHDKFSAPNKCRSCNLVLDGFGESVCVNRERICLGCAAAVEPCPPQVPCQDRFRRNVISSAGKWIDGYVKQQERHHLLVYGAAHDLVTYKTLATWKHVIDQQTKYQTPLRMCGTQN